MTKPTVFIAALLASAACSARRGAAPPSLLPRRAASRCRWCRRTRPMRPWPTSRRRAAAPIPSRSPPISGSRRSASFDAPFAMAFLPDGGLLVTEKAGVLKLRQQSGETVTVSGLPAVATGGQGGLLDVALAPDFRTSKMVYLSFAEPGTVGSALALARGHLVTQRVQCIRAPCPRPSIAQTGSRRSGARA